MAATQLVLVHEVYALFTKSPKRSIGKHLGFLTSP
jgi:hypothetical protein